MDDALRFETGKGVADCYPLHDEVWGDFEKRDKHESAF
jgi:hypothetical protein